MSLNNDKVWLFCIFAIVTLFAGGSFLFVNDNAAESEPIQFTDLSDADINMILAVKDEMSAAEIQSN